MGRACVECASSLLTSLALSSRCFSPRLLCVLHLACHLSPSDCTCSACSARSACSATPVGGGACPEEQAGGRPLPDGSTHPGGAQWHPGGPQHAHHSVRCTHTPSASLLPTPSSPSTCAACILKHDCCTSPCPVEALRSPRVFLDCTLFSFHSLHKSTGCP